MSLLIPIESGIDQGKLKNFYLIALHPAVLKGCKFMFGKQQKIENKYYLVFDILLKSMAAFIGLHLNRNYQLVSAQCLLYQLWFPFSLYIKPIC